LSNLADDDPARLANPVKKRVKQKPEKPA